MEQFPASENPNQLVAKLHEYAPKAGNVRRTYTVQGCMFKAGVWHKVDAGMAEHLRRVKQKDSLLSQPAFIVCTLAQARELHETSKIDKSDPLYAEPLKLGADYDDRVPALEKKIEEKSAEASEQTETVPRRRQEVTSTSVVNESEPTKPVATKPRPPGAPKHKPRKPRSSKSKYTPRDTKKDGE